MTDMQKYEEAFQRLQNEHAAKIKKIIRDEKIGLWAIVFFLTAVSLLPLLLVKP